MTGAVRARMRALVCLALASCVTLAGCGAQQSQSTSAPDDAATESAAAETDTAPTADGSATEDATSTTGDPATGQGGAEGDKTAEAEQQAGPTADELRAKLSITAIYHDEFVHGDKPAEVQKYIVMHDTEGTGDGASVVEWWASNGNLVAAHFVVNTDGTIVQCVPIDKIAHHAGFGDTGHNDLYGVQDESRDDKLGTVPIGDWASDYGMNSYSVGIEMVHMGNGDGYPEEQLEAVDGLIAYLDAAFGHQSEIIDHNDWRTGNSDCSEQFQPYLKNLQQTRTHDGS